MNMSEPSTINRTKIKTEGIEDNDGTKEARIEVKELVTRKKNKTGQIAMSHRRG